MKDAEMPKRRTVRASDTTRAHREVHRDSEPLHSRPRTAWLRTQLSQLADNTQVYPGHDYLANNLEFTLDREPDNEQASDLLGNVRDQNPNKALVSTLAMEKEINTFFRLQSPTVIAKLREAFPGLSEQPDPETVFLKLRELRNRW